MDLFKTVERGCNAIYYLHMSYLSCRVTDRNDLERINELCVKYTVIKLIQLYEWAKSHKKCHRKRNEKREY